MREIGIYVHIPFCARKCKYCDFVSYDNCSKIIDKYVSSLLTNIEDIDKILEVNGIGKLDDISVDTIYFGGGTPSFIDSKYVIDILNKIRKKFNVNSDAEITIEVNSGTVNEKKLLDYYNNGINRLSIGLQSTNNEILHIIGRIHTYEDFLVTYNLAKKVGFKNINVDLMLALPGQSVKDLEDSLIKVINLNPTHISLYSLILEEGTELEKEVNSGKLTLPSDDLERKMYHKTKKILEENGYIHYEISNFAKKGFYSKHNMNCWKQHEYIGFGLASHSYINNIRFSYEENLDEYILAFSNHTYKDSITIQERQDKEGKMKEYAMLGLRTIQGINLEEFEKKFNVRFTEYFKEEIEELESKGLIDINSTRVKLSDKGLDFANIVFMEFV